MKEVHSQSMTFSPHDKDFQTALLTYMDEYKPSSKELKYAYKYPSVRPDVPLPVPVVVEGSSGSALH